jgi:phosphate-selective porin OprO/OprP
MSAGAGDRASRPACRRRWSRPATQVVACLAIVLAGAHPVAAQTAAPAPAPAVTAGWNEGFFIQTPNGDNRLQIGFVVQADGRFSTDDPPPITNTFVLRKVRPTFTGRVAKFIDFKVMPEMAGGSVLLLDGYFDIRFSPKLRLRSGKDKTPVGYELLISDAYLIFPERSLVSLLVPNRDVGFQAQGDLAGGKLVYSAGVFNGNPPDGANTIADIDTNNGKDLAGRVVIQPFKSATTTTHALSNFGFHLGGSAGRQAGALASFRTSAGQTLFSFPATTIADGRRNRVSPAMFLYFKSFGAFAEYARTTQEIVADGVPLTVTNQAWGAAASYVLTGEATSERGVRPRAPFDPVAGTWGALQVAARYAKLTLDDELLAPGVATANASRIAQQVSLAVNWFLNNYVKIYATYERSAFSGQRANENLILFRTQLAF